MKPCRKQNAAVRRQAAPSAGQPSIQEAPVHRYVHPIRTVRPSQRSSTEELLSYVLEALSRQSEQLDELIRRTEGDNSDTR